VNRPLDRTRRRQPQPTSWRQCLSENQNLIFSQAYFARAGWLLARLCAWVLGFRRWLLGFRNTSTKFLESSENFLGNSTLAQRSIRSVPQPNVLATDHTVPGVRAVGDVEQTTWNVVNTRAIVPDIQIRAAQSVEGVAGGGSRDGRDRSPVRTESPGPRPGGPAGYPPTTAEVGLAVNPADSPARMSLHCL